MPSTLPTPPTYHPTGRWRLKPQGDRVLLQLEENTRPYARPDKRWRDATPQDIASLVAIDITPEKLNVAA